MRKICQRDTNNPQRWEHGSLFPVLCDSASTFPFTSECDCSRWGFFKFSFLLPVSVLVAPPQKRISSEQSFCPCTGSALALQILALKGQTYPLDPHALQLFLQHFLQDGVKLLQEVWVSPQGFQQPLLPTQGSLLPVWSKGVCWYQCSDAWAVPWGGGWWDPSPL